MPYLPEDQMCQHKYGHAPNLMARKKPWKRVDCTLIFFHLRLEQKIEDKGI
jgi:hypothetical protein